jgi:hypothetical protein
MLFPFPLGSAFREKGFLSPLALRLTDRPNKGLELCRGDDHLMPLQDVAQFFLRNASRCTAQSRGRGGAGKIGGGARWAGLRGWISTTFTPAGIAKRTKLTDSFLFLSASRNKSAISRS